MKEAMDHTSARAPRGGQNSIWVSQVLQHIERYHAGVLADLLDKRTQLPVQQAPDRSRAHPNLDLKASNEELLAKNDELHSKALALNASTSELQYHLVGTQIATIIADRDLRILRCTPGASRFVDADLLADMRSVLRTETGMERIVHCADRVDWFLLRIVPVLSQNTAVTGVGVTVVNVTNLKKAQEAERRYSKLLELSPDAVFVWHLDDGIETWNRAQALYGFTFEEACGKSPQTLLTTVCSQPWPEVITTLRETGFWEGESQQRTKDGRSLTVSSKLVVMHGEDSIDRVLESNRDITERKAAEVEHARLIEALREADQNKSQFLAMLSHELRNPLASIRTSLVVLDRAVPGGEQAKRANEIIKRQTEQLTRLVDDLLDTARISRGKLQVRRSWIELGELLRRTIEDHRANIAKAGINLEVCTGERPLWVNSDAARLVQAIGNLLTNATKFSNCDGHLRVSLEKDGVMAVIRVRDDGVGISAHLLERLFEPFEQVEATLDRSEEGLGLGLAVVKGLVEQHGGEVNVYSAGTGRGTEFAIRLPLVEASIVARPEVKRPLVYTAHTAHTAHTARRILIVEDNVDAADSLRDLLELSDHEVQIAYDGPDGLKKAREFKPDVVFCDIGLPEMDGYSVARQMRADPGLSSSVFLVALTGYALPEDIAEARKAGFDKHLVNPLSIEKIEEVLESLGMCARDV
jgi:two-component system CheB/CheR fusion protein